MFRDGGPSPLPPVIALCLRYLRGEDGAGPVSTMYNRSHAILSNPVILEVQFIPILLVATPYYLPPSKITTLV